jgi:hypothetical protein
MNPKRTNRAIADALRSASSKPYQGSLDELARRIDAAAVAILTARRPGVPRTVVWWEFTAEWARMLVPIGVTVAAACVAVLWLMRPAVPAATQSVSGTPSMIAMAVRHGAPASDLVDRAVEELVSPSAAPVPRPKTR